jgi:uncharacterized protein (TIGR00369 family)
MSGFVASLGLVLTSVGEGEVTATLDVGPQHHQPYGLVHGGVYCSMVETAASIGAALWAMNHDMVGAVGVSNSTDFLRSHREGELTATATPIHQGRTQQLWQVEITDGGARLVARGQVRLQNLQSAEQIGG